MAILVQQQVGCVNIIDTAAPAGEQIKLSLALDSVASPFPSNDVDYIQTYDCHGKPIKKIYLNGSLEYQDLNAAPLLWSGSLDDFCNKLNNEYFVPSVSTTPPVGGSTSAHQLTQIDQTALKKVGYVLDLTAYVPPPYTELVSLKQTIEGDVQVYEIESKSVDNTEELAKLFNDLQTDIYYGALDANRLYFVPVSTDIVDVEQIDFEDTSEGNLIFNAPYTATVDIPTGALHQIVILLQQLVQQGASAYPAFSRQSVPFGASVSFENFKKLSVIIHAPDGIFDARFGSDTVVTLPYTDTVDGERIKGLDFDFGSSKTARTLTLTNNSPDTNYFISYSIIK